MIDYVGLVREMEYQHKRLSKMLKNMEKAQVAHEREEAVSEALNVMSDYSIKHFKFEEHAMEITNYPDLDQHRAKHKEFLEKTTEFCVDRTLTKTIPAEEIIHYLRNWLRVHHKKEDQKVDSYLRGYIESQGGQGDT